MDNVQIDSGNTNSSLQYLFVELFHATKPCDWEACDSNLVKDRQNSGRRALRNRAIYSNVHPELHQA